MELTTIGGGLVKAALPHISKAIAAKVESKLNPTDLQKALEAGIQSATAQEKSLPVDQYLFYFCDDKETDKFLTQVFKDTGVQGELEKPLKNTGSPDIAYLVEVFKQTASDLTIKLNTACLERWVREFTSAYFERTNAYLKFQVAKEDYFKQLVNWFDDVKFAGIAVPGQEVEQSEKLAQIFVMPDVVEDIQHRTTDLDWVLSGDEMSDRAIQSPGDLITVISERSNHRQEALLREQRQRAELRHRSGKKFLAQQLLHQSQASKVVLLGAPGSGKTTLMSYFAVMSAQKQPEKLGLAPDVDWLPILIRMRDLAKHPNTSILEYAKQFTEKRMAVKTLPTGFFEHWLEDGRALILLDGLDEVPEESKRYEVVRLIENFLGQFKQSQAIVTSRPAGYKRDFFRTEDFPHYELQPFDESKVNEFIHRWYQSRFKDQGEAQRREESLKKALSQNDRIRLLSKNPLILTIIALIHRYQALLPKERHKLYDKAVETLLTSWDANKELSSHQELKYLELDDLRRLMEKLACWIHRQGSTGDQEGGTLIDRDELIEQLSQAIKTQKQVELHQARQEAKRFVEFIRDRTGLLNEQGQDCYAFVHKTFQEYLCAQEINYQADDEDDFDIVLDAIKTHLHDPHWREVLLLLIAQQKPKKAARAIRSVVEAKSEYEQWLHRDLLFAGSCLAENPKDLKVADNGLVQKVLIALVKLEVSDALQVGNKLRSNLFQTLCSLDETEFEVQALQLLKSETEAIDQWRLLEYQAALGEQEAATVALLALLQDENLGVRARAAEALGKLGNTSEEVVQRLLALLQDENFGVRARTASALGDLGNTSEEVLQELLTVLQDEVPIVRNRAAEALGKLGNSSEEVLQGLLTLLQDEISSVRSSASWALGKLGNSSEEVLQGLLTLLQDEISSVRNRVAYALGDLSNSSEEVLQGLLALLQDENSNVRKSVTYALGKLGNRSEVVLQELLTLLHDQDPNVRNRAAWALGDLSNSSEEVLQGLLTLLQDEVSIVRNSAAEALGRLGNNSEVVVQGLLTLLQDEVSSVRNSAAWALGDLGNSSEMVVQGLLTLLQDEDSSVRYSAIYALSNLDKKSVDVLSAVVDWIEQHQDSTYVGSGIDALWGIVEG